MGCTGVSIICLVFAQSIVNMGNNIYTFCLHFPNRTFSKKNLSLKESNLLHRNKNCIFYKETFSADLAFQQVHPFFLKIGIMSLYWAYPNDPLNIRTFGFAGIYILFYFCLNLYSQLARKSGPTSGRQRYDVATSYHCRPDVGPTFLACWVVGTL